MESACIRDSSGGPSVRVGGNLFSMAAGRGGRVRKSRSNKISSITLSCISLSAPSALRLASSNKSIMIGNQGCGLMHVCLAWRSTLVKLSTTTPSPFTSWIIIPPSSCQRPSFNPIRTVFSWNETWNTFARKDGFQSILPTRVKFTRLCTNFLCLVQSIVTLQSGRLIFASTQASNRPVRPPCGSDAQPAQERLVWRLPARRPLRCRRQSGATGFFRHCRDQGASTSGGRELFTKFPSRSKASAASRSRQAVSSSSRCDTPAKSGRPDFSISDGVRRGMPIAESDSRPFG